MGSYSNYNDFSGSLVVSVCGIFSTRPLTINVALPCQQCSVLHRSSVRAHGGIREWISTGVERETRARTSIDDLQRFEGYSLGVLLLHPTLWYA